MNLEHDTVKVYNLLSNVTLTITEAKLNLEFNYLGDILGQNCVRLSDAALDDLLFSKICFIKISGKFLCMNIGVAQVRSALYRFFIVKELPFISLGDVAFNF